MRSGCALNAGGIEAMAAGGLTARGRAIPAEAMEGQTFSGRQAQRVNLAGLVPDLAYAGRKLIAFGESADTVPERLRRIGVGAAGVRAFWGRVGGRGAG
jgi:hypothetical protein